MKFGQALSVFEAALPEEVAGPYRAALTKLQEAAPPMPARTVHMVLAEQLGADWREQVPVLRRPAARRRQHRAGAPGVWHDGREVAVKVQYPGAGPALISDLNQLARAARLFAALSPGLDVKPLLTELKARVAEELDYRLEAGSQRAFAEAYDGDPDIVVPKVVAGSERVLVTEWIDGTPLSAIIRERHPGAARPRRPAAGALPVLRAGRAPACCTPTRTPATSGCWPTAGSACSTSARSTGCRTACPSPSGRLARLALAGDAQAVYDGLREEGFILPTVKLDPQPLLDFLLPLLGPIAEPEFTLHPGVAAQRGRPDRRPPQPGVGARPPAQPAAVVPADPPRHARHDRRAVPAERHRAVPSARWSSGSPDSPSRAARHARARRPRAEPARPAAAEHDHAAGGGTYVAPAGALRSRAFRSPRRARRCRRRQERRPSRRGSTGRRLRFRDRR